MSLSLGKSTERKRCPGWAAALLAPLTKHRYGVLALEIPTDQQRPLTDWATGKTQTVPSFFSKPLGDAADKEGCDCAYVSLPASEDDLKPCSDRVLVAEAAVGARPEPHGSVEPGVLPV